jgi:hypothetical protein
LEDVIRPFQLELVVSSTPQISVDQRHQSGEGLFVTLRPATQELGELAGLIFGHAPLRRRHTAYSRPRRMSITCDAFCVMRSCGRRSQVFTLEYFSPGDEAFRSRFPQYRVTGFGAQDIYANFSGIKLQLRRRPHRAERDSALRQHALNNFSE